MLQLHYTTTIVIQSTHSYSKHYVFNKYIQEVIKMSVTSNFATRLKKLREERELNQSQLAKELNISRGSISYYENQERTPDIETLDSVSKYFDVPVDFLLGNIDTKEKENITIGNELGLSDDAINVFKNLYKLKQGKTNTPRTMKKIKEIEEENLEFQKEGHDYSNLYEKDKDLYKQEDINNADLVYKSLEYILSKEESDSLLKNIAIYIFSRFEDTGDICMSLRSNAQSNEGETEIYLKNKVMSGVFLLSIENILNEWRNTNPQYTIRDLEFRNYDDETEKE